MTRRDYPAGHVGTIYVLHIEPPYRHAAHYVGWTGKDDVAERLAAHYAGNGSPLIRAAVRAGCDVRLTNTFRGTRTDERRLKNGSHRGTYCGRCRWKPKPAGSPGLREVTL